MIDTLKEHTAEYEVASPYISKGFDGTRPYCDPSEKKGSVLMFDQLFKDNKILIDRIVNNSTAESFYGNEISEYQAHFQATQTAKVGIKKLFSAEVKESFKIQTAAITQYSYATFKSNTQLYGVEIGDRTVPESLDSYLTDAFKEAVNNINSVDQVESLINKFGTHVFTAGYWGAYLAYNISAKRKSNSSSIDLSAYAEAQFKKSSVDAQMDKELEAGFEKSYEANTCNTTVIIKGGKSELATNIINGNWGSSYADWVQTIRDYPVLCGYYTNC